MLLIVKYQGLDFLSKLVRKRSGFALKSGPDLVLFWKILVLFKIWVHCYLCWLDILHHPHFTTHFSNFDLIFVRIIHQFHHSVCPL